QEISDVMPQVFGGVPQISGGLMYRDAAAVWRSWNPLFWFGIRLRGCLAESNNDAMASLQTGQPPRSVWKRFAAFLAPALPGKRNVEAPVAAPSRPQAKIVA